MQIFSGLFDRIGLAMAGRKNPWGGKPGTGDGAGGSGGGGDDGPTGSDGGSDSGGGKGGGPRNPWVPGGSGGGSGNGSDGGSDKPRRSATIEDIFKNRGPEGPNRRGGGGGGGPNFQMPTGPGGRSLLPWAIGGAIVVALLMTSVHQVGPKQQGIVTTAGIYTDTLGPGLHFTLPAPIQSVDVENVSEVRLIKIPGGTDEKLILTGDQNLVDLSYLVRWNIKDLKQFKFQLAEPIETVSEVAEAAMRAAMAEQTFNDAVSGAGRAEVEERVRSSMQRILDNYRAGIAVQGVDINKTEPPGNVEEAFKDVSAAEQDADAARNRARQYSAQVIAAAQGEAEAFSRVYEEYRLAPEVTKRRMYYETMERVLKNTDKTVVEAQGVTPYLPLPEIRRRSQQPAAAPAPAQKEQ